MAGVHPITYWVSNLLWDFGLFTIVSIIVTLVITFTDQRELLNSNGAAFAFFLIMFLYGLAGTLMAYACGFVTKSAPSAFALFVIVGLITGELEEKGTKLYCYCTLYWTYASLLILSLPSQFAISNCSNYE